jgi:hypothetical protein
MASAGWRRDTTDDPLVPTSGTYVSAGLSAVRGDPAGWRATTSPDGIKVTIYDAWEESIGGQLRTSRRVWRGLVASAEVRSSATFAQPSLAWLPDWYNSGDLSLGLVRIGARNRHRAFAKIIVLGAGVQIRRGSAAWHEVRWPWNELTATIGLRSKWATVQLDMSWRRGNSW